VSLNPIPMEATGREWGFENDLPPYYDGTHTVLRIRYPGGHEALVFTWAGLLAQNGVNNRDLGVTMNIVPTAKGTDDGVPMPYIIRGILEKGSRPEAVEFLQGLGGSAAPMPLRLVPRGVGDIMLRRQLELAPQRTDDAVGEVDVPSVELQCVRQRPRRIFRIPPRQETVPALPPSLVLASAEVAHLADDVAALGRHRPAALTRRPRARAP
jgi:hypothetical protein